MPVGVEVGTGVDDESVVAVKVGRAVFVGCGEGVRVGSCVGGFVAVNAGGADGVVLGDGDTVGVQGGGECSAAMVACSTPQPIAPIIIRPPKTATKYRICCGKLTKS